MHAPWRRYCGSRIRYGHAHGASSAEDPRGPRLTDGARPMIVPSTKAQQCITTQTPAHAHPLSNDIPGMGYIVDLRQRRAAHWSRRHGNSSPGKKAGWSAGDRNDITKAGACAVMAGGRRRKAIRSAVRLLETKASSAIGPIVEGQQLAELSRPSDRPRPTPRGGRSTRS